MLRLLCEKIRRTPEDIETQYPNCKYILTDVIDVENVSGCLYCVSYNNETFEELCAIAETLKDAIVFGSYNKEVWLQYEVIPNEKASKYDDLSIGKRVKISDLDNLYGVLIVLSDFTDNSEYGVIKYIGQPCQESTDLIQFLGATKGVCVVSNNYFEDK